MIGSLPDFALEVYFGKHEFTVRHHLTASDAQTLTINELLAYGTDAERTAFGDLGLGYLPTWGTDELRAAIASTYDNVDEAHVLPFAGAEEAMFWAMQLLVGPGDHAIITVPNYQSMESVTIATGAEVEGFALWSGAGSDLRWELDLDRLVAMIKPNTKLIAVNFPNNPTGFVPDAATWEQLLHNCDERGIRLFSDEVYRGLESNPMSAVVQAADGLPNALSLNVMSKAYGLPGLRIGWLACRDRGILERLDRSKHYTSICNAGPSEFLAAVALRHADQIKARNRGIIAENMVGLLALFERHRNLLDWTPGQGGCVAFPRYKGTDGVEEFCATLIDEQAAVLLPSSIYSSQLLDIPDDRFRIGFGRSNPGEGLAALDAHLTSRQRFSPT
jgi:aspartate/methionine/tyrosine aminotransferase